MPENEKLKYVNITDVKYKNVMGRTNEKLPFLPLFWTGSGVEINVTGSELWVDIEAGHDFHEPWIAVLLNDALMIRQRLSKGMNSICLFRSMMPEGVKNIKVIRETQAMPEDLSCYVLVKGFKTDGDFKEVAQKPYRIEFIGDSITSGEGSYGAPCDVEWLTMYMSATVNYAVKTANRLNAEYSILSQCGWGVCSAWDNDIRHVMPNVYEKVCGSSIGGTNDAYGASEDYDFSSFCPNAIVVNLGTNDAAAFQNAPFDVPGIGPCKLYLNEDGTYKKEDALKVSKAVTDFLSMIRKNNPTSHIVWVYGMIGHDLSDIIKKGVDDYIDATNDNNAAYLLVPDTPEEDKGAHGHPGAVSHEKMAILLSQYLSKVIQ